MIGKSSETVALPMIIKNCLLCRNRKGKGKTTKTCTTNNVNHICSSAINNGRVQKMFHVNTLFDMFPSFSFGSPTVKMSRML